MGKSKTTWTEEQEKAINSRDGDILVSAAAGSGKTAVLTRRIVDILLDEKNECFADELLVVTFTKAAASEIKNRVESSIEEILLKEPYNERLKLQKDLIKIADISTIHGFCNKLIKENFYALGISPNIKIADELEVSLLKKEAIENVLNKKYNEENNENFLRMLNIFSSEKDDDRFIETINTLYDFLMSHPFPKKWLREKIEFYGENTKIKDSVFFKILKDYASLSLDFCVLLYKDIVNTINQDEKIKDIFLEQINLEFLEIENLKKVLNEEKIEKITERFFSLSFSVLKRFPKDYEDDFLKEKIKNSRNTVKGIIAELKDLFNLKEEDYKEDSKKIKEIIAEIFNFLLDYLKEFSYLKKERSVCDFSDLEHFALKILVKETQSGFEKTKLAESLEKKYKYIMVDECQDINEIQNIIFNCVSKNSENLFMVGDVKQSIYSFRQAMPEIFLKKKEQSVYYTPGNINVTSKIILDRNFRSKKSVLDFINFIFRKILTKAVGEIDYTKEEELVCGTNYENSGSQENNEKSKENKNSEKILNNTNAENFELKGNNDLELNTLNLKDSENDDISISAKEKLAKEKDLACGSDYRNVEVSKKFGSVYVNGLELKNLNLKNNEDHKNEDNHDVELKILDLKNSENKDMDICEANYISELIKNMVNSGYKVKDKDIYRKVRYSDFCILLRNANTHSKNFKDVLESYGIPVKVESSKGILCVEEIDTFLPLLEIIDNPYKEISLVATMLSPLFDFTLDDITYLKKIYENLSLHDCLKKSAKENNKKSLNFLEKINKYRKLSKVLKVSDFLNYLYEDTAYIYILKTQTGSSTKINNLKLLSYYAKNFENEKNLGFSDFLKYLNLLKESDASLKDASFLQESSDAVKIMSIHKSKGLEFPICILANCSRKINKDYDNVLLHPKFGIGLKLLDSKEHLKYSNFQREAVKIALLNSSISEELRILYVALTRAKQKLIIITSLKDAKKSLKNLALDLCAFSEEQLPPYFVFRAQNFSDLILASILKSENLRPLMKYINFENKLKSREKIKNFSAKIIDFKDLNFNGVENEETESKENQKRDSGNEDCRNIKINSWPLQNKESEKKDLDNENFKRSVFTKDFLIEAENIWESVKKLKDYELKTEKKIPLKFTVTKLIDQSSFLLKNDLSSENSKENLFLNLEQKTDVEDKKTEPIKPLEPKLHQETANFLSKEKSFKKIKLPPLFINLEKENKNKPHEAVFSQTFLEKATSKSLKCEESCKLPILREIEEEREKLALEKGTALHKFIKIIDFNKASENLEEHLENLIGKKILKRGTIKTIDLEMIRKFLDSDLMKRILKSEFVLKEFYFSVDLSELLKNLPENYVSEEIMLDGIIDCAFLEKEKFVIIDYKLNFSNNDFQTLSRYKEQLNLYKFALSKKTGTPVKECILYSFTTGKEIRKI